MYFLIFLFLLIFGAIQEWNLTAYVYAWLEHESGSGVALLEVLLSFFLSAALGVKLFRRVGLQLLRKVQLQVARGEVPDQAFAQGFLLVVAAMLLIMPGYISDLLGILTLILRKPLAAVLLKGVRNNVVTVVNNRSPDDAVIIDVETAPAPRLRD